MTLTTELATSDLTPVLARDATMDSKTDTRLDAKPRRLPALKTARLLLRAPARSDVPALVALAGDRRVACRRRCGRSARRDQSIRRRDGFCD